MNEALVWSVVLSVLGLIGIFMAGQKKKIGWAFGFAVQFLWIVFAVRTAQYGFVLSALAYGTLYGRNWIKWRNEEKKEMVS